MDVSSIKDTLYFQFTWLVLFDNSIFLLIYFKHLLDFGHIPVYGVHHYATTYAHTTPKPTLAFAVFPVLFITYWTIYCHKENLFLIKFAE